MFFLDGRLSGIQKRQKFLRAALAGQGPSELVRHLLGADPAIGSLESNAHG